MKKMFTFFAMMMALTVASQASPFMVGENVFGAENSNVRTGQLFVLGEVNNQSWAPNSGIPMSTTDQNIFTVTIVAEGNHVDNMTSFFPFGSMFTDNNGNGYSYFSFSTKLSKDPNDWASIGAYRIGATVDGCLLSPEMFNTDIAMGGFGTTETFKVAAGTYDVTVNLDAHTLMIKNHTASIQGDVNGDHEVSVADINAELELILSGSTDLIGDINGDNEISVGDINALIELILVPKDRTATPTVELIRDGDELWCRVNGEGNIYINSVNYGPAPVMYHVADQKDFFQSGKLRIYALETEKTRSEDVVVYWSLEALYSETAQEPVITYDAATYTVSAVSEDNVVMMIDGVVVENPYTFTQGEEDVTYVVTAYAWADGKENSSYATLEVTVPAKGSVGPTEVTATPVITADLTDDACTITATGEGEVHLYADGVEVENPYVVARGEEDVVITFTATAQEEGKLISETATLEVTVPAKEPVGPTEVTATPVITVEHDAEAYTITATGEGEVHLYADGVEVENPYVVARGEEDVVITFTATAQEEGKLISETATLEVTIYGKNSIDPSDITATPKIVVGIDDYVAVITATGSGEIHMYVDGAEVENPYTIERGDEDKMVTVTATAQEEGKYISETATQVVVIPAKDTTDPHEVGYWLVLIDKDGNEVWEQLIPGADTDYQTSVALNYGTYGTFDYYGGEERPIVNYYFVVDGVPYGAPVDGTATIFGQALENPLSEGMNYYTVPVGYKYVIGIAIDDYDEDNMYVYAAQGGFVAVNELNADKAVAGVRYFNMAGQEMQEANGMTIVVTTYTDGTTSAVKVMK
jgi:hypothetical protein